MAHKGLLIPILHRGDSPSPIFITTALVHHLSVQSHRKLQVEIRKFIDEVSRNFTCNREKPVQISLIQVVTPEGIKAEASGQQVSQKTVELAG